MQLQLGRARLCAYPVALLCTGVFPVPPLRLHPHIKAVIIVLLQNRAFVCLIPLAAVSNVQDIALPLSLPLAPLFTFKVHRVACPWSVNAQHAWPLSLNQWQSSLWYIKLWRSQSTVIGNGWAHDWLNSFLLTLHVRMSLRSFSKPICVSTTHICNDVTETWLISQHATST